MWAVTGDRTRGTVVAAWGGRLVVVAVAVYVLLVPFLQGRQPSLTNVVWVALLGSFLWTGAGQSLRAAGVQRSARDLDLRALATPALALPAVRRPARPARRAGRPGRERRRPPRRRPPGRPARPRGAARRCRRSGGRPPRCWRSPAPWRPASSSTTCAAPTPSPPSPAPSTTAPWSCCSTATGGRGGRGRPGGGLPPARRGLTRQPRAGRTVDSARVTDARTTTSTDDLPYGPARRRGPLRAGERVQLTDSKGRLHTILLTHDGYFQSQRGSFRHSELIGRPEGTVLTTATGHQLLALRPLLSDYVLSMPRGATVVYPKDAGQIVQMGDIFPGARVVEAGVGLRRADHEPALRRRRARAPALGRAARGLRRHRPRQRRLLVRRRPPRRGSCGWATSPTCCRPPPSPAPSTGWSSTCSPPGRTSTSSPRPSRPAGCSSPTSPPPPS